MIPAEFKMGQSVSSQSISAGNSRLSGPYADLLRRAGYGDLLTGGAEDGAPSVDIGEYAEGRYAKTKENYIRDVASSILSLGFGQGKIDPNGDYHKVAKEILDIIPSPSKNGKRFKVDAKEHEKVCKAIAKVLNDKFTPGAKLDAEKLIDPTWAPEKICYRVGEIIEAMGTGMHTEFLGIYGQIKQNLKNMQFLREAISKIVNELTAKCGDAVILDSSKPGISEPLGVAAEGAKRLLAELETQIAIVQGLTDTTLDPAEKGIADSMEENSQQYKLAKRLGLVPGTSEYSEALSAMLSGFGTTAAVASQINKAFEKIGKVLGKQMMGAEEFMNKNEKDMNALLDGIESQTGINPEVMVAVKKLRDLWHKSNRASATIGGESKRSSPKGGEEEKSELDKRVLKQRNERLVILEEFIRKSTSSYEEMVRAIAELSPMLGRQIPITDKLTEFKNAITRVFDLNEVNINTALIGFDLDATAREKRETFLSGLRLLISSVDDVLSSATYKGQADAFNRIKTAASELVKTIDQFSDVVKRKYGGEKPEEKQLGGAVSYYLEEKDMPKIKQSVMNLRSAIKKFNYFFYIAKFRENVAATSGELAVYGENYVNVLADAIGGRRGNSYER